MGSLESCYVDGKAAPSYYPFGSLSPKMVVSFRVWKYKFPVSLPGSWSPQCFGLLYQFRSVKYKALVDFTDLYWDNVM